MPNRPELLAPVGGFEQLSAALTYGADAVYLSGRFGSLRAPGAGFSFEDLGRAVALAHGAGVRVYYCLNAFVPEAGVAVLGGRAARLADYDLDGIIVADPGVAALVRENLPHVDLHVSTQANTVSHLSARFWRDFGATRVNLARELDMLQIRELVRNAPGVETEVFVHGAQCLSVSGRCLLSQWLSDRSANQGLCTQPCRYDYRVRSIALEERLRPGETSFELEEAAGFSRLLAPDDLCLVGYLPWLVKAGVAAVKIEGRTKTAGYLARVLDVYRTALDDHAAGRFRYHAYVDALAGAAGRRLSTGMFLPGGRRKVVAEPRPGARVLARVARCIGRRRYEIAVKGPLDETQPFRLVLPGLSRPVVAPGGFSLQDADGASAARLHSGTTGVLVLDRCIPEGVFLEAAG